MQRSVATLLGFGEVEPTPKLVRAVVYPAQAWTSLVYSVLDIRNEACLGEIERAALALPVVSELVDHEANERLALDHLKDILPRRTLLEMTLVLIIPPIQRTLSVAGGQARPDVRKLVPQLLVYGGAKELIRYCMRERPSGWTQVTDAEVSL
jgi:hypothetical protein